MLARLNELIIECSDTWWKFLLVLAVQVGTLQLLQRISNKFPEVSGGTPPFDMQNALQPAEIFEQLEAYTPQAFDLYAVFQAIDFVFPFAASLMIASACAFFLRHISTNFYQKLVSRKLLLLFLIPAAFDYLENIFLLWVVKAWPEQVEIAATLAVAAKMGKLTTMMVAFALSAILLVAATVAWIARWNRADNMGGSDEG
jgi:hypothetical protein